MGSSLDDSQRLQSMQKHKKPGPKGPGMTLEDQVREPDQVQASCGPDLPLRFFEAGALRLAMKRSNSSWSFALRNSRM